MQTTRTSHSADMPQNEMLLKQVRPTMPRSRRRPILTQTGSRRLYHKSDGWFVFELTRNHSLLACSSSLNPPQDRYQDPHEDQDRQDQHHVSLPLADPPTLSRRLAM